MTRGEVLKRQKADLATLVAELNADDDHRTALLAQNAIVAVHALLDDLDEDGAADYDFPGRALANE
jgi:hypothetical protein